MCASKWMSILLLSTVYLTAKLDNLLVICLFNTLICMTKYAFCVLYVFKSLSGVCIPNGENVALHVQHDDFIDLFNF